MKRKKKEWVLKATLVIRETSQSGKVRLKKRLLWTIGGKHTLTTLSGKTKFEFDFDSLDVVCYTESLFLPKNQIHIKNEKN